MLTTPRSPSSARPSSPRHVAAAPRANHAIGRTVELNYQGQAYKLTVGRIGPHRYRVDGDAGDIEVDVDRLGDFESRLVIGDRRFHVVSVVSPARYLVEVDGISHQISQDDAGVVRAPAPARSGSSTGRGRRRRRSRIHSGRARIHEDGDRGSRSVRGQSA